MIRLVGEALYVPDALWAIHLSGYCRNVMGLVCPVMDLPDQFGVDLSGLSEEDREAVVTRFAGRYPLTREE